MQLTNEFELAAKERNDFIHAAIEKIDAEGGEFPFLKIDYEKYGHTYRRFKSDKAEFSRMTGKYADLCKGILTLLDKLKKRRP